MIILKKSDINFKNIKKYMPSIVFCLFIFIVMIVFIISPSKSYSATEKRMLAEKPSINMKNVFNGEYGENFEEYLSDHIPFRNFFTGVNAYYKLFLGQNNANGVYLCNNGYIIGEPLKYDSQLEVNTAKIVKFAEFFKENFDISTVVTVVPSTGYIMEDSLPSNHKSYNDGEFLKYIKDSGYIACLYGSSSPLTNIWDMSNFEDYDTWVAHYETSKPSYKGKYEMWQYTSNGKINGIKGRVDLNVAYFKYV